MIAKVWKKEDQQNHDNENDRKKFGERKSAAASSSFQACVHIFVTHSPLHFAL